MSSVCMCVSASCLQYMSQCAWQWVHPGEWFVHARACVCVCTIFRHISNRMHLGKRYEFSRASMILTVSSLSFFSFFFSLHYFSLFVTNFPVLLVFSYPHFSISLIFLIKTVICHYYSISHYIHPLTNCLQTKTICYQSCFTTVVNATKGALPNWVLVPEFKYTCLFLTSSKDFGIDVKMTWKAS